MDRRAWQATVQGVARVRHNLTTLHGLTLNLSSYLERWVLSSCSLSTTPRLPVCLGVEFSRVTGAPVFTSNGLDFVATAQGIILNCLALEAGGG